MNISYGWYNPNQRRPNHNQETTLEDNNINFYVEFIAV